MNDFFDSLKDIKKELQKEQNANLSSNSAAKNARLTNFSRYDTTQKMSQYVENAN